MGRNDYIGILANSVHAQSPEIFWVECLERYLVGMCAAATQDDVVNHTVLLLFAAKYRTSERLRLSTTCCRPNCAPIFLRGLINLSNKDDLAKIAQAMLINLDEFEG